MSGSPNDVKGNNDKYAERKVALKQKNTAVTRPIMRLDRSYIPKKDHIGAKKRYTPTKMLNRINKYFEWCEESDEIPSIKGLTLHLKLTKSAFYVYMKYPEFEDIMEQARLVIAHWAEMDVYNTKGVAAGKLSYMKNVHGWSDKLETVNHTEVTQINNVDQAMATIERLAPLLLEALGSRQLVEQVVNDDKPIDAEYEEANDA